MCKRKKISSRQRVIFLDVLRTTGNVSASARAANISARMAHNLRKQEEGFAQEWDLARDEALDELEAALRKRAIDGVEKPVYYAGKECGVQRSYSDSVGMYILKSQRGDRLDTSVENATKNQEPVREISARELLMEKLDAMARNMTEDGEKDDRAE